ncbi:hypothetical protein E6O75_ATG04890 [Venturia nashicola]|uniref:HMG box domain-containing protein n=1 Tax=Venturia nashicola TaxID=86259 RepID=A0A4Z1PF06_9PEZI|nr:hypothetical protein E6O75_ATG04890 [Venturia nashicola]
MLRYNAFTRVAAGAVQASSSKHVVHLTRTLHHLSLSSKLAPVSALSGTMARSFATKVVKKKTTIKAKAKTPVKKKKTPAKPAAKAKKSPAKKKKKTPVRKKAVKKKKKVAAKPKKPKKRVLTEAQKAKAAKTKALNQIKDLKKTALLGTLPKIAPETAWTVFVSEKSKGTHGIATGIMKATSEQYKALTASELEHYNHVANQNKAANEKAYVRWVNSYTPEQIRVANIARTTLKRKVTAGAPGTARGLKVLYKIKDERQPKRPSAAYIFFYTERRASHDTKNISLGDVVKLITKEWNALGPAEKKASDHTSKARYVREFQSVYGHPAPLASAPKVAA